MFTEAYRAGRKNNYPNHTSKNIHSSSQTILADTNPIQSPALGCSSKPYHVFLVMSSGLLLCNLCCVWVPWVVGVRLGCSSQHLTLCQRSARFKIGNLRTRYSHILDLHDPPQRNNRRHAKGPQWACNLPRRRTMCKKRMKNQLPRTTNDDDGWSKVCTGTGQRRSPKNAISILNFRSFRQN